MEKEEWVDHMGRKEGHNRKYGAIENTPDNTNYQELKAFATITAFHAVNWRSPSLNVDLTWASV